MFNANLRRRRQRICFFKTVSDDFVLRIIYNAKQLTINKNTNKQIVKIVFLLRTLFFVD